MLNALHASGRFTRPPPVIMDSLNNNILQSLTYDWEMVVKTFTSCLYRWARSGQSLVSIYVWEGADSVTVREIMMYNSVRTCYVMRN